MTIPENLRILPDMPGSQQTPPTVRDIIKRFGSRDRFAELVGVSSERARTWSDHGSIPGSFFAAIVRAGQQVDVEVTHDELAAIAEAKRLEAA